ncbi:hypothetical protein M514_07107 [Trichuris suis]|uniref:RING-type domain-containing protein n=1 Tax=Trichuris suis TaxID=68888 RepID=A0A085NPL5_9BILA|nr:hypothetical protein M514_07107 [Trichuris suis]
MLFICVLCRRPCIVKELSLLSCGHGLHRSCLTNGILLNSSCPKCCRPFCRIPPVSKVYLDGEQPAENDKECGNSEQADLVNTILENRKQYQAKIEERTEELLSFDKKIREVGERLKTTGEAVSDIVELEEEWQSLESAIGEVKKENRRLRRLLKISENGEIMNGCCATNGDRNTLLCSLNVLARQYVHLKQKRADIMKLRLRQTPADSLWPNGKPRAHVSARQPEKTRGRRR